VGKTFVAADALLWFFHGFGPCIVVTTAPTWRQVKTLLWGEVRGQFKRSERRLEEMGIGGFGGILKETELRRDDRWYAVGLSTAEPERFQGYHSPRMLVIFDEAPGVRECVWEAAEGLMTSEHCRMLAIGNPLSPGGPFYEACRSKIWRTIRVPATESPNAVSGADEWPGLVTRRWVDERRDVWGEGSSLFRSRALGEFPEEGPDTLIALSLLERAMDEAGGEASGGSVGIGADVARFGDDRTVITAVRGGRVVRRVAMRGRDLMDTASRIADMAREFAGADVRIAVDDTGLGGGVTDKLRELGLDPLAMNFGGRALRNPDRFERLRDELWWNGRERFREGSVGGINEEDVEDLSGVKTGYSESGRVRIEAKADIKSRRGRSPDSGESLLLALWAERDAPPGIELGGSGRTRRNFEL